MPDGRVDMLPPQPMTWQDAVPATGQMASPLRSVWLSADAGEAVVWHRQRPLFQGTATTAQSIPNTAYTAITGLAALVDNYGGANDTSNTGRYYGPITSTGQPSAGDWYLVSGYVPMNFTATTGIVIAGVRVSGGTVQAGGRVPGSAHAETAMVVDLVQMTGWGTATNSYLGDWVELMAYQSSGAAATTLVSGKAPALTVRWVCASPAASSSQVVAAPGIPHTWTASDIWTADATGAGKVPLNRELRDAVRFMNYPPIARVTVDGSTQTIPSGATWTSLSFTTEYVDTHSGWAPGTPTKYIAPKAGLYYVGGFVNLIEAASPVGYRAIRLLQNGTTAYAGWSMVPQTTGTLGSALNAVGLIRMAAGDTIEVQVQQTQGAALSQYTNVGNAGRLIAVWMSQ
ncbi:hypothetical protein EBO15_01540 [Actinomadura harenae]|uniref:Uncharacterized protein n=2 Tax=Actinomadura harenae TaxID=2483351 RepID=A0A3M2MDI8_9ACTN|nr:hypothetical protein EBO15_01540 [Actinomadura harenae]